MKTFVLFFLAFCLLAATSTFAQEKKTTFENVCSGKTADGTPCINLGWKKGAENTAYYLIERSVDGKEFKQVGLVFTSEDASFCNYKFRDKIYSTASPVVYYRIGMVNDQKMIAYLPVKKVALSIASNVVAPDSVSALVGNK